MVRGDLAEFEEVLTRAPVKVFAHHHVAHGQDDGEVTSWFDLYPGVRLGAGIGQPDVEGNHLEITHRQAIGKPVGQGNVVGVGLKHVAAKVQDKPGVVKVPVVFAPAPGQFMSGLAGALAQAGIAGNAAGPIAGKEDLVD